MTSLRDCESVISDGTAVQWRQVNPAFLQSSPAGTQIVMSGAFVGVPDDRDRVSLAQASLVTAEQATKHHRSLGWKTEGSWPLLVAEIEAQGARVIDDSACEDQDTPGHSYIDMRGWGKAEKKAARAEWARIATEQGRACA